MPFAKGRKKTGGKVLGCKHKITRDVRALLDELGCNPIEGLARIAVETQDEKLAAHCHAQLAKYIHPQLQSVQLTGADGGPLQHEDVTAREKLANLVAEAETTG